MIRVSQDRARRLLGSDRFAVIDHELNAVGGVKFFGLEAKDATEYISLFVALAGIAAALGVLGAAMGYGTKLFIPGIFMLWALHSKYREKVDRRRKNVMREDELPSVLETLAAAAKSGITLEAALRHVAATRKGTVAELLGEALARCDAGEPLETALEHAAAKGLHPSFRTLARSVAASRKTAEGLGDVLDKAVKDIWEEKKIEARERAGKLSGKLFVPILFCYFIPGAVVLSIPFILSFLQMKNIF